MKKFALLLLFILPLSAFSQQKVLELEERKSRIREKIEQLEDSLKLLDEQIDYVKMLQEISDSKAARDTAKKKATATNEEIAISTETQEAAVSTEPQSEITEEGYSTETPISEDENIAAEPEIDPEEKESDAAADSTFAITLEEDPKEPTPAEGQTEEATDTTFAITLEEDSATPQVEEEEANAGAGPEEEPETEPDSTFAITLEEDSAAPEIAEEQTQAKDSIIDKKAEALPEKKSTPGESRIRVKPKVGSIVAKEDFELKSSRYGDGQTLMQVKKGTQVQKVDVQGDYVLVCIDGKCGYAHKESLEEYEEE